MEDTFPDLGSLSDKELKEMIDSLTEEENEISYKRRVLHGKIDILRAELVTGSPRNRATCERLPKTPAGKPVPPSETGPPGWAGSARVEPMAVHCPECGFANPEGA